MASGPKTWRPSGLWQMPRRMRRSERRPRDVLAVEHDAAGAHRLHAGQGAQEGGLAGAIGADQGNQFALADFEVDALERLDPAVAAFHALDLEQHVAAGRVAPGFAVRRRCGAPRPIDSGARLTMRWNSSRNSAFALPPNRGSSLSRKARVDLGPVVGSQRLAGEGHDILFLAADVALYGLRVAAQGRGEGGVGLAAAGGSRQLGTQVAQDFGAVVVLDLQALDDCGGFWSHGAAGRGTGSCLPWRGGRGP